MKLVDVIVQILDIAQCFKEFICNINRMTQWPIIFKNINNVEQIDHSISCEKPLTRFFSLFAWHPFYIHGDSKNHKIHSIGFIFLVAIHNRILGERWALRISTHLAKKPKARTENDHCPQLQKLTMNRTQPRVLKKFQRILQRKIQRQVCWRQGLYWFHSGTNYSAKRKASYSSVFTLSH